MSNASARKKDRNPGVPPASSETGPLSGWIDEQMRSIPFKTKGVTAKKTGLGGLDLAIPLVHKGFTRRLRPILKLSDVKRIELDALGAHLYDLCDGTRSVEQIMELYQEQWNLTFFESRALILSYLRLLSRRNLILFLKPGDEAKGAPSPAPAERSRR